MSSPPPRPEEQASTGEFLVTFSRLLRTVRSIAQRQSEAMGFSGTPFGILRALDEGDRRPGDLAAELQIAPSVISRALASLERDGLIERRIDPTDARSFRVALTGLGRERLAERRTRIEAHINGVLDDWPDDDIVTMTRLMGRLETTIRDRSADLLEPPPELAEPPPSPAAPPDPVPA